MILLFEKATISATSVAADSTGTNLDFWMIPAGNLITISAVQGQVILYFRDGNPYSQTLSTGEALTGSFRFATVTLNVTTGKESEVAENFYKFILAGPKPIVPIPSVRTIFKFSNVTNEFADIADITSIDTIKRYTTYDTISGTGGGSLPTGGVVQQVLTKQSATDGDADWEYPDTLYIVVRNISGVDLDKGTPVHATGVTGTVPDVIVADASSAAAMPATYILNENILNNAQGVAIITGVIENVDTSLFLPGDKVYVAAGGGFTNVKPTGTNLIQNLGVVTKSNASTGSGVIYGAGRSNDVPNLPTGKFFIGSASNTTESVYTLPTADGTSGQVLTTDGAGAVTFQTAGGGDEYIQFNGSANNGNAGQDRYIPLGGNYVDTSAIQVYSEAMCPFNGVVESITVRTNGAAGSTTTKLWVNGTTVNSSTDTLSANTPLTIAFGDSVSTGDLIACSMNTTSAAGDSYVTVLIKKS